MHQTWSSFSYSARDQTLVVNLVLIFLLTDLACHANQFLYPFPKCLLHFASTEKPDAPGYSHLQLSVDLRPQIEDFWRLDWRDDSISEGNLQSHFEMFLLADHSVIEPRKIS